MDKVYFAPGNPGVLQTPKGHEKRKLIELVPARELEEVAGFCIDQGVDLVDVGSENPLEEGLIDLLNARGIRTIGPKKEFAKLESDRHLPTISCTGLAFQSPNTRCLIILKKPVNMSEISAIRWWSRQMGLLPARAQSCAMTSLTLWQPSRKLWWTRCLETQGTGLSSKNENTALKSRFLPILTANMCSRSGCLLRITSPPLTRTTRNPSSGLAAISIQAAQDATCPHKLVSPWLINRIIKEIVNPTVNEIYNRLGWKYKGVLYFGLNLDPYDNLDVFEINVRHGDPEWEVLARKLSTDLFEIGMAVWEGSLDHVKQIWNEQHYVDVIAMEGRSKASRGWNKGYPGRYGKGHRIGGLQDLEKGIALYFAGVDNHSEKGLVTYGGRVVHVVAGDSTLEKAREKAYRNIKKLSFVDHNNNGANCLRYRHTIGL